jgi:FolB domain-containing protein
MTNGWLAVEGIRVRCIIGVGDAERQAPQELIVDYRVRVDFDAAAATDSIEDAVDYRVLTRRMVEAVEASSYRLVETLAARLCQIALGEFAGVREIRVEVEKPGALAAGAVRAIASLAR